MTPKLYYFSNWEFHRNREQWIDRVDRRLLVMLDLLRFKWGKPINVSSHPDAVGRYKGSSLSQHNIAQWGNVRAVDIIPNGIRTYDDAYSFYMLAIELGFTGVGFYPDWEPSPGFHVDVRYDVQPGYPVTWGYVGKAPDITRVSVGDALDVMA